jgi:hypothetical protein
LDNLAVVRCRLCDGELFESPNGHLDPFCIHGWSATAKFLTGHGRVLRHSVNEQRIYRLGCIRLHSIRSPARSHIMRLRSCRAGALGGSSSGDRRGIEDDMYRRGIDAGDGKRTCFFLLWHGVAIIYCYSTFTRKI